MDFIKDFEPYRGKYTKQFTRKPEEYLFKGYNYEWRTIYKYLKKTYIEMVLAGHIVIGWYIKRQD